MDIAAKVSLDLGCGLRPHNPFNADVLMGVDFNPAITSLGGNFKHHDFVLGGIPFPDSHFDYVTAFDVLEHVPRISVDHHSKVSRFLFNELMSDIYRVLKPNGVLYAFTPLVPSASVWDDPTHVNPITKTTHRYFCETNHLQHMGFNGRFRALEVTTLNGSRAKTAERSLGTSLSRVFQMLFKGGHSHIVWQLQAVK
jgi:SAM-dependent methyltransferase